MGDTAAIRSLPDAGDLPQALAKEVAATPARVTQERWTWFDTFDWRLHRKGLRLCAGADGRSKVLAADSGRLLGYLPGTPRFAEDLPASALGERVAGALSVRALLPIVEVRLQRTAHERRDHRGKVVARLHRIAAAARAPGAEAWIELPHRLEIEALKGYAKAARVIARAADGAGLTAAKEPLFLQALAVTGRWPGDYDSKIDVALDSDEPAGAAVRCILRGLLSALRANENGTRAALDSEFLHDFRVAVRRIRSLLGQVKGALPAQATARLQSEFAWLQQLTGPARDLDVYLLHMPVYETSLPESERHNLAPLRAFLERRRQSAYRQLIEGMDSARYAQLLAEAEALIADDTPGPKGRDCVGRLANRRIHKIYRRVLAEGAAIGPDSPAASLHELRKTCKKLRYLMEFFRSLYPRREIAERLRTLKGLQEHLGDYQDLCVQAHALRAFSGEMAADGTAEPETLLALGRLIERLEQRAAHTRAEFAERFARFARRKIRRRFERLFGG